MRTEPKWLDRLCSDERDPLLAMSAIVLAPHPDDETIGLGGRLVRLEGVLLIYVTDGAPRNMLDANAAGFATREAYAAARQEELGAALALAGIETCQTRTLGMIDQEASLDLVGLTTRLCEMLTEIHAELILTPSYEGGHPDHDATAFAIHAAAALLEQKGFDPPTLIEYALYHDDNGAMSTCAFLANDNCDERTLVLPSASCDLKRRMLACFATQQKTLAAFPVEVERFRYAPRYDFSRPPHSGTLYYERHDWGMAGAHWRALAHQALERLGFDGTRAI